MVKVGDCPFCFLKPEFGSDEDGGWVECPSCHVSTGYCSDLAAAIEEWNDGAFCGDDDNKP
jgi:hypothetical protein